MPFRIVASSEYPGAKLVEWAPGRGSKGAEIVTETKCFRCRQVIAFDPYYVINDRLIHAKCAKEA